jgi:hypothetical protein
MHACIRIVCKIELYIENWNILRLIEIVMIQQFCEVIWVVVSWSGFVGRERL